MKRIFTLSLLILSCFSLKAQPIARGFHLTRPVNMSVLSNRPSLALGFSSVSEARTIINDIMGVVNMQQNFTVLSTTQVDNAAAVTYQGQRYILYNPNFINQLDNLANDRWASISVVAHEIGHHLLGHTLDGAGSQVPKELAADEFSGMVLHRMGATLQQAQLAMKLIGSPYASATHPAENDRLTAISRGWNSTGVQSRTIDRDVAIEYPNSDRGSNYPNDNRNSYPNNDRRSYPTYPSDNTGGAYPNTNDRRNGYPNGRSMERNDGRYGRRANSNNAQTIIYDVRFKRSNGEQYFITSQNNVVKYNGSRLLLVAKITSTNNSTYPYVIYDDQQQLYVDRRGNIFSDRGMSVGLITQHS